MQGLHGHNTLLTDIEAGSKIYLHSPEVPQRPTAWCLLCAWGSDGVRIYKWQIEPDCALLTAITGRKKALTS